MSTSKKNVLANIDNIKVSSNEYLAKYTFWRNFKKLLENDINLDGLYAEISGGLSIGMYVKGNTYRFGEILWYLCESKEMIVIIRSLHNNNSTYPERGGLSFEDNGWETLSLDVDIYSMDIMQKLGNIAYLAFKGHQDGEHPYGILSRENIDKKFMRADLSNMDSKRESFFFPYTTGFLPVNADDKVILNGSYRYYDNGLLEYDIIYRFGYVGIVEQEDGEFEALTCNNVVFDGLNGNSRYFYNSDAYSIFYRKNDTNNTSQIDDVVNLNRNDFVNTYFAKIDLPVPFLDTNYMVFSGDVFG